MFETAELGRVIDKEELARREPKLRLALLRAQDELKAADFPVIILLNGAEGAGKGETANLLHEWMDARFLRTYAVGDPHEEELQRPPYWKFWMALPARGHTGVFLGSWYTEPIIHRVLRGQRKNANQSELDAELDAELIRVKNFESALIDDGALLLKFWFHISHKEQRKRFKKFEKNKETRWRVSQRDWRFHALYDEFRPVCERTLRQTSTGEAPWVVVEGTDARYRHVTVAEHVIDAVGRQLKARQRQAGRRSKPTSATRSKRTQQPTILDQLDLSQQLAKKEYERSLELAQARLARLSRRSLKRGVGAIAVFEGWDAAGKGGVIRRITGALDARHYRVIPIAAPTDEERAHHYLWRFWRHLPRLGALTLYDRSWYGRVLVERVEGFASESEWRRAYHEINDFEEQLVDHGIALAKFWLHISKDEQLRRFRDREAKSWKRHKITEEDWRNRKKWSAYETAANEMIERTSTEYAPWTLVEANDKRFARLKVITALCDSLEQRRRAT